jgi:hypothetical protein
LNHPPRSGWFEVIGDIAEAEPQLSWSSMRIQPTNIKNILASLETEDGSNIADLISEAARDWRQREMDYKP